MRVLIAGGTGFIGSPLTINALGRGWEVYVLTRDPGQVHAQELAEQGAVPVQGDLTRPKSLQKAFSEVHPSHYFHNAGWYELGIPASKREKMWSINVQGLINALDAAEQIDVEKIVLTSSTTALGDTDGQVVDETFVRRSVTFSWYEHTLQAAHGVALTRIEAGAPIVMGSPAQAVGHGDHSVFGIMLRLFLRRMLPPTLWAPEGTFSFVHVEDVARGLVRIMEDGQIGQNYFMSGSQMSNREMLAFWKEKIGRSIPIVWIPRSMAMIVGFLAAPLLRFFGQPAFISPEVVRSSYASFRFSDEKIRNDLGVKLRSAEEAWMATIAKEKN
jgi:nucleoside-diphosphate-sugar epimerase